MNEEAGGQSALERIANALEREIARRDAETASREEESRRTRWAVVFLIILLPILWAMMSIGNPKALEYWTSDPARLAVVLTVGATITAAIVQAIRMDAYSIGALALLLALFLLVGLVAVVTSRREEYIAFSVFYFSVGVRAIYSYLRSVPSLGQVLEPVTRFGRDSYIGRLIANVTSLLPLIGVTPFAVYTFTHKWEIGNWAAAGIALVGTVAYAFVGYRRSANRTKTVH
jgi:hypothetical protein